MPHAEPILLQPNPGCVEDQVKFIFFKQLQQPCFPIVNYITSFLSNIVYMHSTTMVQNYNVTRKLNQTP